MLLAVSFFGQTPIARSSHVVFGNVSELVVEANREQKLNQKNIPQIRLACANAIKLSLDHRLRDLSDQLMNSFSAIDSIAFELEKAEILLACRAPEKAQKVLQAVNPRNESQERIWSILFWKASNAAMDHSNASLALRRLSAGDLQKLDNEEITVGHSADGSPLTRLALDLLAEHERLNGDCETAARVLLSGRKKGALGATRMSRAVQCLENSTMDERNDLLASALAEASADQAWWLVGDILRMQITLGLTSNEGTKSLRKRFEYFAKELDDRYTQWELILFDKTRQEERRLLEDQLRSPRGIGANTKKK